MSTCGNICLTSPLFKLFPDFQVKMEENLIDLFWQHPVLYDEQHDLSYLNNQVKNNDLEQRPEIAQQLRLNERW